MAPIRFTVLTNDDRKPVGKQVGVREGRIATLSSKGAHPTSFEVKQCGSAEEVFDVLRTLGPTRCIVAGVPVNGATRGDIVLKRCARAGALTTGADDWTFPDGPGLFVLDFDTKSSQEGFPDRLRMTPQQWRAALRMVAPGLLNRFIFVESSGSCLHLPGQPVPEPNGFHHYVVVDDARDIPRAGRVLFERLLLAGFGYGRVLGDGRIVPKTIVDEVVWHPNRLFYTGGPARPAGIETGREFKVLDQAPVCTRAEDGALAC